MVEKFRIALPTGNVFVIDPLYIAGHRDAASGLSDDGSADSVLEFIAGQPNLAFYEWNLRPGTYDFKLNAIKDPRRNSKAAPGERGLFSVDSATALVADVSYFTGILSHFEFDAAFTPSCNASKSYIRKLSTLLGDAEENAFVIVCSPGIQHYYQFIGDGRYYLERSFSPSRPRRTKTG
ncbi:hypothetical protein SH528x_003485 [Novipirellula sp. SH528]|uniref:hypothetical protein n=1 Tax=Novipirellula sp. SH528 TaxID=3454466 RepID=UPI003F9F6266